MTSLFLLPLLLVSSGEDKPFYARYREAFGMTHLVVRAQIPGVDRTQMESSLEQAATLATTP